MVAKIVFIFLVHFPFCKGFVAVPLFCFGYYFEDCMMDHLWDLTRKIESDGQTHNLQLVGVENARCFAAAG